MHVDMSIDENRQCVLILVSNQIYFVSFHGKLRWVWNTEMRKIGESHFRLVLSHLVNPQSSTQEIFNSMSRIAVGCFVADTIDTGNYPCHTPAVVTVDYEALKTANIDTFPNLFGSEESRESTFSIRAIINRNFVQGVDYSEKECIFSVSSTSFRLLPLTKSSNLETIKFENKIKLNRHGMLLMGADGTVYPAFKEYESSEVNSAHKRVSFFAVVKPRSSESKKLVTEQMMVCAEDSNKTAVVFSVERHSLHSLIAPSVSCSWLEKGKLRSKVAFIKRSVAATENMEHQIVGLIESRDFTTDIASYGVSTNSLKNIYSTVSYPRKRSEQPFIRSIVLSSSGLSIGLESAALKWCRSESLSKIQSSIIFDAMITNAIQNNNSRSLESSSLLAEDEIGLPGFAARLQSQISDLSVRRLSSKQT